MNPVLSQERQRRLEKGRRGGDGDLPGHESKVWTISIIGRAEV